MSETSKNSLIFMGLVGKDRYAIGSAGGVNGIKNVRIVGFDNHRIIGAESRIDEIGRVVGWE